VGEDSIVPGTVASVGVKVGGEKHSMILTEDYVSLKGTKWIFREDTSYIPVNSIDSIFYGWKRHATILVIGLILIIGGFASRHLVALIPGIIVLLIFWFFRPRLLLIRSVKESLGGNPVSGDESEKFIAAVTKLLSRK